MAIVLLRAAWHKTAHYHEAIGFAQGYKILPESSVPYAVCVLACLEWLSVIALISPGLATAGAWLAGALFTGYGLAMARALQAGRSRIDCGCGGAPMPISRTLVLRNAGYAALAVSLPWLMGKDTLSAPATISAIAAGVTIWAGFAVLETLATNAARMYPEKSR